MNKLKKILNIIKNNYLVILIILFLLYTAMTIRYLPKGTKELSYQYIIISLIGLAMGTKMILKKEKIVLDFFDIALLGLTMSSAIPLIFNKAVSIEDAMYVLNQYIILYEFYIIIKQICLKNYKVKNIFVNVIIILTIVIIAIGIKQMTVDLTKNYNVDTTRLESTFYSPNTLATLIGGTIFLAFGQLFKQNKKIIKIVYMAEISILILGLVLTYSRFMYAIFALMLLIYFILNKEKRKEILIITIVTGILAVIYSKIYSEILFSKEYYKVWVGLLINIVITTALSIMCLKFSNILKKVNIKIAIIIILIPILIGGLYLVSVMKISKPFEVFGSTTSSKNVEKSIYNIKGNCKYLIEFDIEAKGINKDDYTIIVVERNKYMDYIDGKVIKFGEFYGIKQLELTTSDTTTMINLEIKSKANSENEYLKINKLTLNGKEAILSYKYLPTSIVERFSNIGKNNKSISERFAFYKDAIEIIKQDENLLFGIGGKGWKYKYLEVQSYEYISTDVHNYPLQILLEFGIVGFAFLVAIFIVIIKELKICIKNKEFANISIICALMCILIHSCLDYSMAFFYIMIIVRLLLAIISSNRVNEKQEITKKKFADIIVYILIIIAFFYNFIYGFYIIKINKKVSENLELKEYETIAKMFPYDINARKNILMQSPNSSARLQTYKYLFDKEAYYIAEYDFLIYSVEDYIAGSLSEKNVDDIIKIQEFFYKTKNVKRFNLRYQINRIYQIIGFGDLVIEYNKTIKDERLEKIGAELYDMAQDELDNKKRFMLDYEKGRYDRTNIPAYEKEVEKLQEDINKHKMANEKSDS